MILKLTVTADAENCSNAFQKRPERCVTASTTCGRHLEFDNAGQGAVDDPEQIDFPYTRVRLACLERCLIIEEVERPTLGKPQWRVSVIRVAQGNRLI